MSVVGLNRRVGISPYRSPAPGQLGSPTSEGQSGVWPDSATEVTPAELRIVREQNRPAIVIREILQGVAVSVGMVIALITALNFLNVR